VRLVVLDKEAPGAKKPVKDIREQEVYLGELPLMTDNGTFVVNGTSASSSRSCTAARACSSTRPRQDPQLGEAALLGTSDPLRGSWLDFEFDARTACSPHRPPAQAPVTILLRALGYSDEQILDLFFEKNTFFLSPHGVELALVRRDCAARPRASRSASATR